MARRPCPVLVAVALVWLAMPASASAHLSPGRIATDFEARVGGFDPPAPGLSASVLGGDQKLRLDVAPSHVVVVDGLIGEPFLRFSTAGVAVNLASPTAATAHVIPTSDAISSTRPVWRPVSGGHEFAWHENRLRPRGAVRGTASRPRAVARWSIPMLVDGRRTRLVGTEWYATHPPLTIWLVLLVAALAAAVVGGRRLPPRAAGRVAVALLAPVVVACLVGWLGIFLAGGVSSLGLALAGVYGIITAVFVAAVVAATSGTARLGVLALIGALVASFTIPELEVFARGFVLSALPAAAARTAAAVSFGGGLALAIVCAPGALDLLRHAGGGAH